MTTRFTLATFNVNSIRARLAGLSVWLDEVAPDVVCLQETKVRDGDFPLEPLRDGGWHVAYHGQKSYNGVAIASRHPLENVLTGFEPGDEFEGQARLLRATVQGIRILNAYVPQGASPDSDKFTYKLRWLERLRRLLDEESTPDGRLVLTGDLNIAADEREVHDPKGEWGDVCYREEVVAAFRELTDWGLVDVYREHNPEKGVYSFYDYRVRNAMERGVGWRIDYILATRPLAKNCVASTIDLEPRRRERPSDHTPLRATFEW